MLADGGITVSLSERSMGDKSPAVSGVASFAASLDPTTSNESKAGSRVRRRARQFQRSRLSTTARAEGLRLILTFRRRVTGS